MADFRFKIPLIISFKKKRKKREGGKGYGSGGRQGEAVYSWGVGPDCFSVQKKKKGKKGGGEQAAIRALAHQKTKSCWHEVVSSRWPGGKRGGEKGGGREEEGGGGCSSAVSRRPTLWQKGKKKKGPRNKRGPAPNCLTYTRNGKGKKKKKEKGKE